MRSASRAEQARVLERYHTSPSAAPAPASTADGQGAARRDRRAAGRARHRLQPERAGRRAGLCAGARRRGRPRRTDATACPRGGELPRRASAACRQAAITLSRSSVEPFLQFSARRDLREKVFRGLRSPAATMAAPTDNKAIIAEMVRLRAERAQLLGYPTFAALPARRRHGEDAGRRCATCSSAVWTPARARALADRDALQALIQDEGGNFALARLGLALLRGKAAQGSAATSTTPRSSPISASTT